MYSYNNGSGSSWRISGSSLCNIPMLRTIHLRPADCLIARAIFAFITRWVATRKESIFSSLDSDKYAESLSDHLYVDSEGRALDSTPMVCVMLIGLHEGYTHRVTLGWIFLKDLVKASRVSKQYLSSSSHRVEVK